MLRSCSHFPQRCELPAECQPRSSSGDSGTWSEGDSPLPLQSRGGAPLLPQVVPRQVRVLPLHTERGAVDQDLQCYRDLRWRECQSIFFFFFFGFLFARLCTILMAMKSKSIIVPITGIICLLCEISQLSFSLSFFLALAIIDWEMIKKKFMETREIILN